METETNPCREEGELSDDSDNYTPLERPPTYSITAAPPTRFSKIIESESDEDPLQSSSETDSDLDTKKQKPKKAKFKIKPKASVAINPRHKKFDIWSTRIQEDVLSETLNSCDVSLKDRSRDVESYDYTLSRRYQFDDDKKTNNVNNFADTRTNNKRSRDDRRNINLRPKKKQEEETDNKGAPRKILDLTVGVEDPLEDVVKDIANKLYEEKEDLITKIVTVAGKDKAFKLFKEVQKIESDGGMLIMNKTRRRTPGGVYFFLAKKDSEMTESQHNEIFGDAEVRYKQEQKDRRKKKHQQMKAKILAGRRNKDLPEFLSKAELCVQKLATMSDRTRKETDHEDVVNPPPTPETDGHDNENSGDGMEQFSNINNIVNGSDSLNPLKVVSYEDDYLDMTAGTDMDLF